MCFQSETCLWPIFSLASAASFMLYLVRTRNFGWHCKTCNFFNCSRLRRSYAFEGGIVICSKNYDSLYYWRKIIWFVGLKLLMFFAVATSTADRDDRDRGRGPAVAVRGRGPSRSKFGPRYYLWLFLKIFFFLIRFCSSSGIMATSGITSCGWLMVKWFFMSNRQKDWLHEGHSIG